MGDVAALCWPHPDMPRILSECGQNTGLSVFEVVRHDESQCLTGHDELDRQPSLVLRLDARCHEATQINGPQSPQ